MRLSLLLLLNAILMSSCDFGQSDIAQDVAVVQAALPPIIQMVPDSTQERKWTYLEREIAYLMNIWPGDYDNVEQLDYHKYAHPDPEVQPLRLHASVEHLVNEAFGENVLYVEEYISDDPSQLTHRAIYQLQPNEEKHHIEVRVYKIQAALSIEKEDLEALSPSSPSLHQDESIILSREGLYFKGKGKKQSVETVRILIDENRFFVRRNIYESGKIDHQMEKARCFVCMIDFPREKGGRPVKTEHYIDIHDQGGKFEFDYSDGRHMVLGMRNTWSYGMQRETFVIFIQEGSQEGKTLIYSWGEPGADRIGFNPGWIRVQCDLDTPENRQFQKDLRPDS